MNHLKGFRTLNRTHAHRKALYRNMAEALFRHERIVTTVTKAKELRSVAEKIITRAKVNNLHAIRIVNKTIKDEAILHKLFNEIAPRYVERPGGYTRIIKLAKRKGDGADMCIIELVEEKMVKAKKKKTVKSVQKTTNKVIKEEPIVEETKKSSLTKTH